MEIQIDKPELTTYQEEILYNGARFTIATCSTKVGKTYSALFGIFEAAHQPQIREGDNFWWVAPTYAQTKIAYKRLKRDLIRSGIYKFNNTDLVIECPNGAEIHFKTASDSDNLFGDDVVFVVLDEAGRCNEDAWYALRSTLTATNGKAILIGNFGGSQNWVTRLAEKAKSDPEYHFIKVTAYDAVKAGILSKKEIEQAKKDLPENQFRALYLAEGGNDERNLIQNESLIKLPLNSVTEGIKYLTGDIARFGADKTVLLVWSGLKVIGWHIIDKSSLTDVAVQVQLLKAKHNINLQNILLDENGIGAGVIDMVGCRGFVNNSKPIKVKGEVQNFASLKDQCYYKLAEMINANLLNVLLPHSIQKLLIEELEQVKEPAAPDVSKLKIVGKEAIKKKIGRSPDYSDAIMLRMFFELNPFYGQYHLR
ncbi:terminase large subunit domain-containing protein [Maribacter sp. 2210JD10-5]|uniref:terminase large subunit domain-containing protein n=1 Tax=Maribacter sp. 2210JD10-5 TaxID=3386272 RepID=UPI0039BD7BE3